MDELESLRDKAARTEELLTRCYGVRRWKAGRYSDDLVGALVATILSQNTSDINSGRAFQSLKSAFPAGWDDVRTAPVSRVADAIRMGGMANQKAPRIQAVLEDILVREGRVSLQHLRDWDNAAVLSYLTAFHGVGAKTAACVLMFNMGRDALPVDTHVFRVSQRIGLVGPKANADAAHVLLPPLLTEGGAYSFHVHLIEHGRSVCHARGPNCAQCPLTVLCDWHAARPQAQAAA